MWLKVIQPATAVQEQAQIAAHKATMQLSGSAFDSILASAVLYFYSMRALFHGSFVFLKLFPERLKLALRTHWGSWTICGASRKASSFRLTCDGAP
jgi:hypothetical protein